ncbi:MAG: TetR/AcrR family transcriptional regulator [Firmicutes bacterium]|nr:TetR/AcrR family transcriptional regulator [Bacillota bacterium]
MQYLKEEIREKILSSALTEFERYGFSGAQMQRIALGAGICTSNIYRYFAGKDKIFAEIVQTVQLHVSTLIFERSKEAQYGGKDVKSTARYLAKEIVDVYINYGRQLLVITEKSHGSNCGNFKEKLLEMVCQRISSDICPEVDNTLTYSISNGLVESVFIIIRNHEEPKRMEELIRCMLVFYFDDLENRIS